MNDTNPVTPQEFESTTNTMSYDSGIAPHPNTPFLIQRITQPAIVATSIVAALGVLSLCTITDSIFDVAFIFPFSLGPLVITGLFGFVLSGRIAQWILASSSICYGVWFMFMYAASVTSPSSTAALVFLVIGLYSLPVLFFFWFAACAIQVKATTGH